MASKPLTHLLWIDLETGGLDLELDGIFEVGAILTNTDLDVIEELEFLVSPSSHQWSRMVNNEFVVKMHTENGLLDALNSIDAPSVNSSSIGRILFDLLTRHGVERGQVAICGSGVAKFDYPLLQRDAPELVDYCAYFVPTDTGMLRRSYQLATGRLLTEINESKTHRGIDDIRCHLAEAKVFRNAFRLLDRILQDHPEINLESDNFDPTAEHLYLGAR